MLQSKKVSRAGVQFGPSASVGRRISLRACISRRIRYNKCVYSIDRGAAMKTLLIQNIASLVSCDEEDR